MNFIEEIITLDISSGKIGAPVTRFPPEPNGYLHIGHAKSIVLNFGIARRFGGITNLRFDDTNPSTENFEYVESIKSDIRWLGFNWENEFFASDYFERLFELALSLVRKGMAYVDDSTPDEIAILKGSPTIPGNASVFRLRSVEENEDLFFRMKKGEFAEGSKTLRAKIDLASSNMILRDPILYRIKFTEHYRTGDKWCIYPMYDFAHGQCDAMENITHSLCTLEFAAHRELYNWLISKLELYPSKQYEFARMSLTYTILSKRQLLQLVAGNYVNGWDDPRMPTLSGLRRRGYTPEIIIEFCNRVGIAKRDNLIDVALLEYCAREHLNKTALRRMVVFDPVKVIISNWPKGNTELLLTEDNPEDASSGSRQIPFSGELYIEREDFMEDPPKKFFRLSIGKQVRLKSAFIITCDRIVKDSSGIVQEIYCTYLPESRSGNDVSGKKVQGTLHWVSQQDSVVIEINEYDRLFNIENPSILENFLEHINKNSLRKLYAYAESNIVKSALGQTFQFIRKGYYCLDKQSTSNNLVFNRIVTLKDTWNKFGN